MLYPAELRAHSSGEDSRAWGLWRVLRGEYAGHGISKATSTSRAFRPYCAASEGKVGTCASDLTSGERRDLQDQIQVVDPDVMVLAEEFGALGWQQAEDRPAWD